MFKKQIDILAIGDTTTDAFIRLKDAHINCRVDKEECQLCLNFGDKVPFEYVKVIKAVGNAANAAVAASRLGLRSALVSNLGDDQNGRDCLAELERNRVSTSFIKINNGKPTNYHYVLWYEVDRTILVNHTEYDYELPKRLQVIKGRVRPPGQELPPKWIYLSSLAANTFPYHLELADYLEAYPGIKLCFQPGTFQIKLGFDQLKRLYERTDLLVVNVEEAQRLLDNQTRDLKVLLRDLASHGPKLVAITDSTKGSYLFDGDHYYHMPMYPDPRPPLERTGCGDAWSATFVSALAMGKTPLEALTLAPINPMSVAQFIGAQEGLLNLEQLEWWLSRSPSDYRPREI